MHSAIVACSCQVYTLSQPTLTKVRMPKPYCDSTADQQHRQSHQRLPPLCGNTLSQRGVIPSIVTEQGNHIYRSISHLICTAIYGLAVSLLRSIHWPTCGVAASTCALAWLLKWASRLSANGGSWTCCISISV